MQRKCPECGDKIIGRADKKFCSDSCRNAHNNRLNKDNSKLLRNTNNRLRKNYRILQALNPKKTTKCPKAMLTERGFDFNLFTSIYTTKAGTTYFFVYDQGYLPLEGDFYALVRKDS